MNNFLKFDRREGWFILLFFFTSRDFMFCIIILPVSKNGKGMLSVLLAIGSIARAESIPVVGYTEISFVHARKVYSYAKIIAVWILHIIEALSGFLHRFISILSQGVL